MRAVSINIDFLARSYFYFDTPVPYKLKNGEINIYPVSLRDSEIFLSSLNIFSIDKNILPDPKIIQMSYLQFICQVLLEDPTYKNENRQSFYNILYLCLKCKSPRIKWKNPKTPVLFDDSMGIEITPKEFDDIKRIIMYQNILHYDDEYINPELKEAMNDVDELKNKNLTVPSLERKMAIITAHTGLPKKEQETMSYRSHCLLFEEVCGEVEFITIRPAYMFSNSKKELDHWIFKKPKDKFEGYTKSVDSYTQSMGGSQAIKTSDEGLGDSYMQSYNNFKQKQ